MGAFSSIGKAVAKPFEAAGRSVRGNLNDAGVGSLFSDKGALLRAVANPTDLVAVGQTFNRSVEGDSATEIVRDADGVQRQQVKAVGKAGQTLFDDIWHGIYSGWHSFFDEVGRAWSDVGGKKLWVSGGNEIERVIDKWGGEQRVMGWVVFGIGVVIYILISIGSFGTLSAPATIGLVALAGAMTTYGAQTGLAPRSESALGYSLFAGDNIDNSHFQAIGEGGSSGSGQSASGLGALGDLLGSLKNLSPVAAVGVAGAAALSLYLIFKR